MIDRKIHYCWFGNAPLPPLAIRCIGSWNKRMPNFEIIRWDERNTDLSNHYAQTCIRNRKWAFLSDYVRLQVLHDHGGIYLDVDVEVLKPMDDLLKHRLFFGWESSDWINAGVIGAERGNPHMKKLSELISSQTLSTRQFVAIPQLITGYLTRLASESPEEVTLFDSVSFYPYNPWDANRPVGQLMAEDITDETFSIHHWQQSWKDTGIRHFLKQARVRLLGISRDF